MINELNKDQLNENQSDQLNNVNQSDQQNNQPDQLNNLNQSDQLNNVNQSDQLNNELKALDKLENLYNNENLKDLTDISFNEIKERLKSFDTEDKLNANLGIQKLIDEFIELISISNENEEKVELFTELSQEMKCLLLRKGKIKLSDQEIRKRKKRIREIKKEIKKLDKRIKELKDKEIDLESLEEDKTLIKITKKEKRLLNLYKKLRELENKPYYLGDNLISFSELTSNQQLNQLLINEYSNNFENLDLIPKFKDVDKLINSFLNQNQINENLDSNLIYEKMVNTFRSIRRKNTDLGLNSYLNGQNVYDLLKDEPETLKKKLDEQNKFHQNLIEMEKQFKKKASQLKEQLNENEEETSDSETDSQDLDEAETASSSENEFIVNDDDNEFSENNEEDEEKQEENESIEKQEEDESIEKNEGEKIIDNNLVNNSTNDNQINQNSTNDTTVNDTNDSNYDKLIKGIKFVKEEIKESTSNEKELINLSDEEIKLDKDSLKRKVDDANKNRFKKSKHDDDDDCIIID